MSTRSNIAIKRKDGTRTGIYCHYDGYVEGVGVTLQLAYNTAEKVEALLKLGDLSSLGYYAEPNPDKPHNFENRQEFVCVAYHRDRGEEFAQSDSKQEYNYIFDEETAVWYVETEKYIDSKNEPEMMKISLESYWRYDTELLITAISKGNFKNWAPDEFVPDCRVLSACIAKAREARAEIIAAEAAQREAYYRAYCD